MKKQLEELIQHYLHVQPDSSRVQEFISKVVALVEPKQESSLDEDLGLPEGTLDAHIKTQDEDIYLAALNAKKPLESED